MAEHTFYGKRQLCYTDISDFTDFRGIGNDPMYKRYDSVYAVVNSIIADEYKHFLAQPSYTEEDRIFWYVNEWDETPVRFQDLTPERKAHYQVIKEKTIQHYKEKAASSKGEDKIILTNAIKYLYDDFIFCYGDKVVVVAWGMMPDSNKHKVIGAIIKNLKFLESYKVRFDVGDKGKLAQKIDALMNREHGTTLTSKDIPEVIANDGWRFTRWEPEPIGHKVIENVTFHAEYEAVPTKEKEDIPSELVRVRFLSGERGSLKGESSYEFPKGEKIPRECIPVIIANSGYEFTGWDKPTDEVLQEDMEFTAQYKRFPVTCQFISGEHGTLEGNDTIEVLAGDFLASEQIPHIVPKKGYRFAGWDIPIDSPVTSNCTFTALYEEEKLPWWKRLVAALAAFWAGLSARGCLKKLLWLLLLLLLFGLIASLLRTCGTDERPGDMNYSEDDEVDIIEEIKYPDGSIADDNGIAHDIREDDGRLPDDLPNHSIVAPITDEEGVIPPIITNPGAPDIIANRLNIFFEDDNVDMDQFAVDFKYVYSGEDYKIIGADYQVKSMQIQIPEDQRNNVRETINQKLPNYKFFVVDESVFTVVGRVSKSNEDVGWHLKAINLKAGWEYERGSKDIVVAIVDNGIDGSHDMFKGRIYRPYNVFTQNNHLSRGDGHGTHVAALAVGSDAFYDKGASGVAPNCRLMPIQVFDNNRCTFFSVTSGIMYAIHNGAQVINVSIGPKFTGLNILPDEDQKLISETQFKNEEKVFRKLCNIAKKNNVIIVWAAGNDDILARIAPENRTEKTINVAAVNQSLAETDFSNHGEGTNISAPGAAIYSAYPINSFKSLDGTSMAAPIVAGTVALLRSINNELTVEEIIAILQQSGKKVSGNIPPMIQVDRALQMAKTGDFEMPIPGSSGDNQQNPDPGSPGNNPQPSIPGSSGDNQQNPDPGSSGNNPQPSIPGSSGDNRQNPNPGSSGNDPRNPNPGSDGSMTPPDKDDQTDYDAIRRMIEEYQRKIKEYQEKIDELNKQLPENK